MTTKPLPLWEVELMETLAIWIPYSPLISIPLPLWEVELMETPVWRLLAQRF